MNEIQAIRDLPYGLKGFRRFCRLLVLEDGSRFELTAWESFVLGFYFAGLLELVIILPKKNGKTTLLAVLALYHLLMVYAAECVIGAASLEQAGIMHRQACQMVVRSGLKRRPKEGQQNARIREYEGVFDIKPGMREIRFEAGRIRTLAADANTADGVIPTLALVDELHRHPSGDLYGVFLDGLGPRNGQQVTISTPGATADSPLGRLRDRALGLPKQTRGKRRVYTSQDFALIEWGLLEEDDPENLRQVKMANPAPWQTLDKLRQRRNSPSMTAFQWRRFGAGMWTAAEEAWLEPRVWDGLKGDLGNVADGERVWVAVRAGAGIGIGIAALRGDERVAVRVESIPPPQTGRAKLTDAEFALRRICERYEVQMIAYDEDQFGRSADLMKEAGLPMAVIPQRAKGLALATATLWRLISAGLLQHDGDPELRAQVLAGQTKETSMGWRLEPTPQTAGLVALAMAAHEACQVQQQKEFWVI